MISIIVPNYNHEPFLKQRLKSIFDQTSQNFEVIILDDSSDDKSVEILEEYSNHPKVSHFIINKKNSGSPFKQWYKGISLAKGEYIWIAESDDFCGLNFLEKIFNFLEERNQQIDIVYSQSIDVDQTGKALSHRLGWTSNFDSNIWKNNFNISGMEFISCYLKVKNVIPNASAVVFRKSLVEKFIFSEELLNMKMCGDWFFWTKLCGKANLGFVAEPLNFFRHHSKVSRNHYSRETKILRLVEEAEIRRYIKRTFEIDQKQEVKKIYTKWVKLFTLKSIFQPTFYAVMHTPHSQIALLRHMYNDRINAKQTT